MDSAGGAAGGSFESIATATGTGSSRNITFTSIPSTYKHLQIRYLGKGTASASQSNLPMTIRLNSDSGSNYAYHRLIGNGTLASAEAVSSSDDISQSSIPNSFSGYTNMFGVGIIDIHDYASTTKTKTLRAINGFEFNLGTTAQRVQLWSGLWNSTSAMTSINFQLPASDNWTTTTVFSLYGIKG
jgi:hypothetical protein